MTNQLEICKAKLVARAQELEEKNNLLERVEKEHEEAVAEKQTLSDTLSAIQADSVPHFLLLYPSFSSVL